MHARGSFRPPLRSVWFFRSWLHHPLRVVDFILPYSAAFVNSEKHAPPSLESFCVAFFKKRPPIQGRAALGCPYVVEILCEKPVSILFGTAGAKKNIFRFAKSNAEKVSRLRARLGALPQVPATFLKKGRSKTFVRINHNKTKNRPERVVLIRKFGYFL